MATKMQAYRWPEICVEWICHLEQGRREEERRGAEGKQPENCQMSKDKGRKRDMLRKHDVH